MTDAPEPLNLTPQAMTLEEGLAAIFPDTIGRRDDGKWPFFTYTNDEHGHTCTAIFDTWPEAVSWAKGVPIVARDEAAKLRAALVELVRLKNGPRDDAYYHDREHAWAAARAALAATEEQP